MKHPSETHLYNYTKLEIKYLSKEKENETIKVSEGTLLTENISLRVDVKKLSEELKLSQVESSLTIKKLDTFFNLFY